MRPREECRHRGRSELYVGHRQPCRSSSSRTSDPARRAVVQPQLVSSTATQPITHRCPARNRVGAPMDVVAPGAEDPNVGGTGSVLTQQFAYRPATGHGHKPQTRTVVATRRVRHGSADTFSTARRSAVGAREASADA
jgi:hypothetical protein